MNEENTSEPGHAPHRILLVDDHPLLRDGLRLLIDDVPDMEVCGEASNADEAVEAMERTSPDLAVVDIFLPGRNGIELTKTLCRRWPDTRVLILSMHDESIYARRALRAGAMGYVMKQEVSKTIVDAVRTVLKGKRYMSAHIAAELARDIVSGSDKKSASGVNLLSDRELEIFERFGRGLTRSEIAERLGVSVKTVEAHRQNIREKLKIKDATDFLRRATLWVEDAGTS